MKKVTSIIIFLLTALIAAGCGKKENTLSGLTLDAAEEKALSDAGLSSSDVNSLKASSERTDGISVYSIEFSTENMKYKYEIHADTGEIYSKSREAVTGRDTSPEGNSQTQQPADSGEEQPQTGQPADNGEEQPQTGQPADNGEEQPQTGQPADNGEEQPQTGQPADNGEEQVTLEAAKAAALTDAGLTTSDVTYTKEGLDFEDGVSVYEIEFYTSTHEYEYEIHAASGTIHSRCVEPHSTGFGHHGNHHGEDHGRNCNEYYCGSYWCDYCHNGGIAGADIGAEKAINIALEHAGLSAENVTFTKTELDWEDGRAVYEIEFTSSLTEYEYKVSAADGAVLEYEID